MPPPVHSNDEGGIAFPSDGNKKDLVAYIVEKQNDELQRKCRELKWWQRAFIGQLIFWVTLFATGKIWLGWFNI